jgi:hypothetical protein
MTRKRLVGNRWRLYWMLYKNPTLRTYRSQRVIADATDPNFEDEGPPPEK